MRLHTLQTHFDNPVTELEQEIARLGPWFHNLHLTNGTQTAPDHPLGDFPTCKWRQIEQHLPASLEDWEVLDIGCNAGFYSAELARRGANVTAIDIDPHYLAQARWAAELLGLGDRIRFELKGVYDLARDWRDYDLVWFMGVIYHLRYPLLGLELAAAHARRLLVVQSLTMPGEEQAEPLPDLKLGDRARMREPAWPKMGFIEHRLEGDITNWWAPNAPCMEAMLRSCGMRLVARPELETWFCEPTPGAARCRWELRHALQAISGIDPGAEPAYQEKTADGELSNFNKLVSR